MSQASPTLSAEKRSRPWGTVAAVAILLAAGAAAYSNSFRGAFIFDDLALIPENPALHGDVSPWQLAFSSNFRTRPVIAFTVALNHALGGFDVVGYHVVNLIIHLLAALVLFGLVRRTLRLPVLAGRFADGSTGLALAISLLWMLHPLQTQSVTYIIQRCESMMGLFYLLTLYAIIRGTTSRRPWGWYAAAILSCILSMGCKQVAVTIPLVVLIYDRAFLAAGWKELARRRWWLYVGLLASWLLVWPGPAFSKEPIVHAAPWWQYALTQPGVLLRYLELAVWPGGLSIDYGWPLAETVGAILPQALVIGALLAITVLALVRRPAWGAVAAAFWLILAPTSSVLPLPDVAFEHRMYLPLASLVALAVIAAYLGLTRLTTRRAIPVILVVVIAAAMGARTYVRNYDYRTALSIWKSAVATVPSNSRAHSNLGAELVLSHGRSGVAEELDEAFRQYDEALRLKPDFAQAHNNVAVALVARGKVDEAIRHYLEAVRLDSGYSLAYCNLGIALDKQGRFEEALRAYAEALRLNPDYAEAHYYMGTVLYGRGRPEQAAYHEREALRIKPDYAEAHFALGLALDKQGRPDEALRCYEESLRIKPDLAEAHANMATLLSARGQTDEAIRHCREAIRINPDLAEAHHNLGLALYKQGKVDEAVREYEEALRLKPDYAEAHTNLAGILGSRGRLDEAIRHCREALRSRPDYVAAHNNLARALASQGKTDEAVTHYRRVLSIQPDLAAAIRNLAWILATDPDPARRSGPEAVRLAERGCQLTGRKDPAMLDALAAAYAEAGRFQEAAATAREAEALAWSLGNRALAARVQALLRLYEAGQPYRQQRTP